MSELSGRIEGGVHRFPVRVYYEDTDASGVVYHARYLNFIERARTELLRLGGADHSALSDEHGIAFAVRRCEIDYAAPARLDDLLEVETRMTESTGASLTVEQRVQRDGRDLVRARLILVCVTREGKPSRLPESVKEALGSFMQAQEAGGLNGKHG